MTGALHKVADNLLQDNKKLMREDAGDQHCFEPENETELPSTNNE